MSRSQGGQAIYIIIQIPLSCKAGEETDAENFVFVAAVGEVKNVSWGFYPNGIFVGLKAQLTTSSSFYMPVNLLLQ